MIEQIEEAGELKVWWEGELIATTTFFRGSDDFAAAVTATDDDNANSLVAGLILSATVALLEPWHRVKVVSIIRALEAKYKKDSSGDVPF